MNDYLFVFDLDFTLWDCGDTWCDHSIPPYFKEERGIFDSSGNEMIIYPDVVHILEELFHCGATIAVASRTSQPDWALELMRLHEIDPYFHFREIYPGSKITHFRNLKEKAGFPYERMVFFEDEYRNIKEVSTLGVNCIQVRDGLSYELYKNSYKNIRRNELV